MDPTTLPSNKGNVSGQIAPRDPALADGVYPEVFDAKEIEEAGIFDCIIDPVPTNLLINDLNKVMAANKDMFIDMMATMATKADISSEMEGKLESQHVQLQ